MGTRRQLRSDADSCKVSPETQARILQLYSSDKNLTAIAKEVGFHRDTVRKILTRAVPEEAIASSRRRLMLLLPAAERAVGTALARRDVETGKWLLKETGVVGQLADTGGSRLKADVNLQVA